MTESEAVRLIQAVSSKAFNKQGNAIEWHPLIQEAEAEIEEDRIELDLITSYALYDENWWGEGPLSWVPKKSFS